jgi:hypothetical protein
LEDTTEELEPAIGTLEPRDENLPPVAADAEKGRISVQKKKISQGWSYTQESNELLSKLN